MSAHDIATVLEKGDIEIVGRITDSSNQALFVHVALDGVTVPACYKTEVGERPLWDFPPGLWRREVAAYGLSQLMDVDLIPITVARRDGPYAPGSLQLWVDDTTGDHYFTLRDRPELEMWFRQLALFDVVANNTDRKSGHVIFDGSRCWAIDQGLCFGEDSQLRTVIWEFAGAPLTAQEIASLERIIHSDATDFLDLISPDEIMAVRWRAAQLREIATFPAPNEDSEWPPYPWPLI